MQQTARMAVVSLLAVAACTAAMAQMLRVRGTLEKVDGKMLAFRDTDGAQQQLTLADNAMVVAVVKASMADLKEGTFLGSAALPQADGSQKALEVHIFPEQMRGTGEGHRPYAPVPQGTMTNGSVSRMTVTGVEGSTVTVTYKDGEKKIVIPPNTPIVRYELGSKSDLKPGAAISVFAAVKKPDGTLEASRINVGRDGVVPQ